MKLVTTALASVALLSPTLSWGQVATAQPEPPSHKGFVELGLGYGYAMSTSPFIEVNNGTLLKPPHASGLNVDIGGGYHLVPGLSLIADLQHARATSIEGTNDNGNTSRYSFNYNSLTLGLRAALAVGPGEVYTDFSLGLALPFKTEAEGMGGGGSVSTTIGYNAGLGGRGEMGYHYAINDRMYAGAGLRLEAFSTDNVGRTRVRTDQNGQTETETYTTNPNAQGPSASALSVQDLRLRLMFGYRF